MAKVEKGDSMEYELIKDSVNLLKEIDDFDERDFRGCSEEQIERLEQLLPEYTYLPESYCEFLRFGGNGICNMLSGTEFYFPQIYSLTTEQKIRNLKDTNFFAPDFDFEYQLMDSLFLFYFHQGYFGRFFHLNLGEDPDIYYYEAGLKNTFLLTQEQTFSEYLYAEVSNFVAQYKEIIVTIDIGLRNRVKNYRQGILGILDRLENLTDHVDQEFVDQAVKNYLAILRKTYSLLFEYKYYTVYQYEYVFSPTTNPSYLESEAEIVQEITKTISELGKQGKDLISYVKELKAK